MSAASVWDDDTPVDRHDTRCAVWTTTDQPCDCGADDTRVVWPLLVPEPGTVAARLDTLPLPCETDGAA